MGLGSRVQNLGFLGFRCRVLYGMVQSLDFGVLGPRLGPV